MTFNTYGDKNNPALMLIPGLGVTYEIFLPLIDLLKGDFFIVAVGIDGFLLGEKSEFTSVDNQAGKIAGMSGRAWAGIWTARTDCRWAGRFFHACLSATRSSSTMPSWMRLRFCLCPNGASIRSGITRALMSGHVTTGLGSGNWCSIRTISTCCWKNARKHGLPAEERPSATDTRTSIPTSWNPSTAPISISGTAPKRPSWPDRRQSIF